MSLTVYQQISIHTFKINNVSNSSVVQIGSAGSIRGVSQLYNTGGFTGPAPEVGDSSPFSFVPLPNPQ
ncbi:spore germination protein GerPB [Paenibacillus yanchengensis]|uniref:Spore germination protein GerPB n=1 Tax=Paenibacillus yanchengensis TaxID=2035833 RepID=A0ABW4YK91_9BACL